MHPWSCWTNKSNPVRPNRRSWQRRTGLGGRFRQCFRYTAPPVPRTRTRSSRHPRQLRTPTPAPDSPPAPPTGPPSTPPPRPSPSSSPRLRWHTVRTARRSPCRSPPGIRRKRPCRLFRRTSPRPGSGTGSFRSSEPRPYLRHHRPRVRSTSAHPGRLCTRPARRLLDCTNCSRRTKGDRRRCMPPRRCRIRTSHNATATLRTATASPRIRVRRLPRPEARRAS